MSERVDLQSLGVHSAVLGPGRVCGTLLEQDIHGGLPSGGEEAGLQSDEFMDVHDGVSSLTASPGCSPPVPRVCLIEKIQ